MRDEAVGNCKINYNKIAETVKENSSGVGVQEAITVLEQSVTKPNKTQKVNTIKNYFSKSVNVDGTSKLPFIRKTFFTDKADNKDTNDDNFVVNSHSKNNFDSEFETTDTESEKSGFTETYSANCTKYKISHEIKECFVLLKRNEILIKDIGLDISKDNKNVFDAEENKSFLNKSNKDEEKLPVHKCEFSLKSLTSSRSANLTDTNIESSKELTNKESVLGMAKEILVTSIPDSSCIDEHGIPTNMKSYLCDSDSSHEQESPIENDIDSEQCDLASAEDKVGKEEIPLLQCFVQLEPVKILPKLVNSRLSVQQCPVALEPVIMSPSIVNTAEKVQESVSVQKKLIFIDENKLCSVNKNKSPSIEIPRTSPKKRVLSTHDSSNTAGNKQVSNCLKDSSSKTQTRNYGKRKIEDTKYIEYEAKKKIKLQECFVLLEPLNLSSQWKYNNPVSCFTFKTKQPSKESLKTSNFKRNIDASDTAEIADCAVGDKGRINRNHTKTLDRLATGKHGDDVLKTSVSGSSNNWIGIKQNSNRMETRNQRENVFFLNETSTYGVQTRITSEIEKSFFKPTTAINKKEKLPSKDIQSESSENTLIKGFCSNLTNFNQNKVALRRSKRKNSAKCESFTSKQLCAELKAKTIEEYFQFVHLTHLYDADFEHSIHCLKAILINTVNYPDMSSLLFDVIKYLSLSETNILLSFTKSKQISVLLPQDEDCIITAFFMIESDENTHLKGLLKATVNMIQNLLISRKTINIYGLASLCRVVTEISKRKNDKLAPLILCGNLLKNKHQFAPYLIASVVSTWMELFQFDDSLSEEEILFHSSVAYGAKKKTNITESDWNASMKILSKYSNSRPVADVRKSIYVLMSTIQMNCCNESWTHYNMLTSAVVIFAAYEDWNWIKNTLLSRHVIPYLNKFGSKTIHNKAFDLFSNLYVDLFIMNPSPNPREEVLIKFFKKENITEGCSFIQESAALALMKFIFLKNLSLPRILIQWFEKNCNNPKVIAIKTLFTRKSKSGDSKQLLKEDFELNVI